MTKPIVVVTIPSATPTDRRVQLMQELERKLYDYHVILILGEVQFPTVEVFYEKDFTEIEYGELKQLILETQVK